MAADITGIITQACFDPGRHTERDTPSEPVCRWQARAVLDALDRFDGLTLIARAILDRHYPPDVPAVCDRGSPDPGPRLAAALHDILKARESR